MVANRPAGLAGSRTRSRVMTTKRLGATTSPGRAVVSSQTIMAATDSPMASTSARRSSPSSPGFRQTVSGKNTIAAASLKFASSCSSQSCAAVGDPDADLDRHAVQPCERRGQAEHAFFALLDGCHRALSLPAEHGYVMLTFQTGA